MADPTDWQLGYSCYQQGRQQDSHKMGSPISTTAKEDERLCSSMNPKGSLEGELGGVWGTLPWEASNAPEPCPQQQAPMIPQSLVSKMQTGLAQTVWDGSKNWSRSLSLEDYSTNK